MSGHSLIKLLLLFVVTTSSAFAQTGAQPAPHCDYAVTSITATDTSTSAGTRTSTSKLKMVRGEKKRTVSLEVATSGIVDPDCPVWDGWNTTNDYKADTFKGQTSATWADSTSSTVNATACNGDSSVEIEIVDHKNVTIKLAASGIGGKEVDKSLASYLTSYKTQPTVTWGGEISGKMEVVDYYDDGEQIGLKASAGGSATMSYKSWDMQLWGVYVGTTGVKVTPKLSVGDLKATVGVDFSYDESKKNPWVKEPKGNFSGSAKVSGALEASEGAPGVVVGSIEITADTGIKIDGTIAKEGKKIVLKTLHASLGQATVGISAHLKVGSSIDFKLFETSTNFPGSGGSVWDYQMEEPLDLITFPDDPQRIQDINKQ